jgi:hypothetical protein
VARERIEVEITGDARDAKDEIDDVADAADDLTGSPYDLRIAANTTDLQAGLKEAREEAQRTEKAVGDIGGPRGAGLAGNAMSDMTGPLGDASSAASDFGGVLDGISDTASEIALRFGASEQTVGKMSGALGLAGFAVAGAAAVWGIYKQKQQEANERIKEAIELLRDARENGVNAYAEKATELVQTNEGLAASMEDLGVSGGQLTDALGGDLSPAVRDAIRIQEEYAAVLDGTVAGTYSQQEALEELAGAHGMTVEELRDHIGTAAELTGAIDQQSTAMAHGEEVLDREGELLRDVDSAAGAAAERAREMTEAFEVLHDELNDEEAYLQAQQGFDDVRVAADAAYLAAATGSADAEQAARDHRLAVLDLEGQVARYAEEVEGISPEQVTQIRALIDQGKLAEAESALNEIERDRTLRVNLEKGGGWAEMSPYFSWMNAGRSTATTSIVINAPRGTRPAELVSAAHQYARRNGSL